MVRKKKKPLPPPPPSHKTGDFIVFQKDFGIEGKEAYCLWLTEKRSQRFFIPKGCTAYVLKYVTKTGGGNIHDWWRILYCHGLFISLTTKCQL